MKERRATLKAARLNTADWQGPQRTTMYAGAFVILVPPFGGVIIAA